MRTPVSCVVIVLLCIGQLSSSSPLGQSPGIPMKIEKSPSNPNDDSPSPTPDTVSQMSSMLGVLKGDMSVDKIITLLKTFSLGKKVFKSLQENVPVFDKFSKDMAKRNVEFRVLINYLINGKYPDLKDLFDIVTSKKGNLVTEAQEIFKEDPELHQIQQLVAQGNLADFANLKEFLQLYYGKKFSLTPSQLTARDVVSLMNMVNLIMFTGDDIDGGKLFAPMFSGDFTSVLRYLVTLDYSRLMKIQALPQDINGGKYTVVHGHGGQAVDPLVNQLMGTIRGKYTQLLDGSKTNSQVENAVYDILGQLVNILKEVTGEIDKLSVVTSVKENNPSRQGN